MLDRNVPRPWQGRTTLVFSLAAVALGLGNLFRLPWLMGEHGGGPFFLAYVVFLLVFTVPLMMAEVMLGSYGRASPVGSLRWASDQSGRATQWQWLGAIQALLALLLAAEVVLVTVWMLDRAITVQSGGMAAASARDFAADFVALTRLDAIEYWGVAGLLMVAGVLAMFGPGFAMAIIGWLILPAIAVTTLALVGYALELGALRETEEFLLRRDLQRFDFGSAMAALLSAAMTLGAGLGIGICFGGRAPSGLPLARSVLASAVIDTLFMLTIALIANALIFAVNASPAQGAPLVFVLLPYAFANLPMGEAYGALFFGATAAGCFAALVALLEPAIMILRRDLDWHRWLAVPAVVALVWALTLGIGRDQLQWLGRLDAAMAILLPLSFLLVAVFVGWRMPKPLSRGELYRAPRWLFFLWWVVLRWLVPLLSLGLLVWQLRGFAGLQ